MRIWCDRRVQRCFVLAAAVAVLLAVPSAAAAKARERSVYSTSRVHSGQIRMSPPRFALLGSRGLDGEHLAPASIVVLKPWTRSRKGLVLSLRG